MAEVTSESKRRRGVMTWLLIWGLFMVVGVGACSAAELEPMLSGTIPVTRESKATEDWPALQPAPSGTPTPIQMETGSGATSASGTATHFPPPTVETISTGTENSPETPAPPGLISPTPTPWDVPSRWPTPTPVPPPPGLVYENETGLWRVTADWQPERLAELERGVILSPDGREALAHDGDDIWLIDLAGGERRNLTEGTGRVHCCAQWWPARPGMIIFGSWPGSSDLGPTTGYLSAYNLDDSSYQVLDEESLSNAMAAPGPDGRRVAYDRGGSAWIYRWEEGPEPLDPADFGLDNIIAIGGPAWSPDGRQLAWTVAFTEQDSDPWRIALAIFDLDTGSGRLLHPYDNVGRGGWFGPPAFSPDGLWLAFVAEDSTLDLNGIWVVAADGSREHYLGPGSNLTWSPDNHWLAYTAYSLELDPAEEVRLAEVESWYSIKMNLPPGSTIRGWLE